MPNSPGYVWGKMYAAIWSMCGRASLPERLANVAIDLHTLRDDDLEPGELAEDLKYVRSWTIENLEGERGVKRIPDDLELRKLTEKMLHILLETHKD